MMRGSIFGVERFLCGVRRSASLIDCLSLAVATEGLELGFLLKFAAKPAPDFSVKFAAASVSVLQIFSFELFKFLLRFSLSSFMRCMISSLFK